MIELKDKKDCCGCEACVQRCPKSCVTMREDNEGFLYPEINKDDCIDCGLCEKVCPVIHQATGRIPLAVYAAKHKNEQVRMASSSGGVFTAIADNVIDDGGIVFGAQFNQDWDVVHGYTETKAGLAAFRGSKYVQSRIGESYKEAEHFLKTGRKVLFSGTPCQIAGLKRFLRKEYDNLLTVDFICHGVPSPGVWREYLKEGTARLCGEKKSVLQCPIHERDVFIEGISFRDKRLGWKKFSFTLAFSATNGSGEKNTILLSEPLNKNMFLRGFLADLYLRPSCHACPTKSLKSGSDITIGDFWGIQHVMPEIDDDKGVSVVMANNEKADDLIGRTLIEKWSVAYDDILRYNCAIELSTNLTIKRNSFFLNQNANFNERVHRLSKMSVFQRMKKNTIRIMRRCLRVLHIRYFVLT